jgi:hypothetical protein
MRFKVYRLRRAGRRLQLRDVLNEAPHFGELVTHIVTRRGRQYSAASLRPVASPAREPQIPDLYEPTLLGMSPLALRLRGYERLDDGEGSRAVLQEWHCELP